MREIGNNIYDEYGKTLVTCNGQVQLGIWGHYSEIQMEAPLYLGDCQLEVKKIGAFTTINQRAVKHLTNNCVIECQSIGRFCMIAHSVHIGLINHPVDMLTNNIIFRYGDEKAAWADSFVIDHDIINEKRMRDIYIERATKSLPIIGNDVWIGYNATILNGVKVGDGAIIGAGSVVTKNIPPYAVVAGNPAKIIKYRFEKELINRLINISWWDYGPDILSGLDISSPKNCIDELEDRTEKREKKVYPTITMKTN